MFVRERVQTVAGDRVEQFRAEIRARRRAMRGWNVQSRIPTRTSVSFKRSYPIAGRRVSQHRFPIFARGDEESAIRRLFGVLQRDDWTRVTVANERDLLRGGGHFSGLAFLLAVDVSSRKK